MKPHRYHPDEVRIEHVDLDASHGQRNASVTAWIEDVCVGSVDYSVYENVPAITMISVVSAHRRRGLATLMVQSLQAEFPDTEIEFGMLTEEGALFKLSLPVSVIEDQETIVVRNALIEARNEQLALQQKAAALRGSEEYAPWIGSVTERWNDLHDRIDDLEQQLASMKTNRTIIQTCDDLSEDSSRPEKHLAMDP